jgi:hypothetical protein
MMAALALRTGMRVRAAAMRAPIVDLAEIAALRPDMRDLFEELMPDYAAAPNAPSRAVRQFIGLTSSASRCSSSMLARIGGSQ